MSERPTVHITNWSSKKLHGPGRKYTIMAKPRRWERGDGAVFPLTPDVGDLESVRASTITIAEYRSRYLARVEALPRLHGGVSMLAPRELTTNDYLVEDGDTLCCACSREAAARGECHRVWAADLLVRAGWRVILDGVELPESDRV